MVSTRRAKPVKAKTPSPQLLGFPIGFTLSMEETLCIRGSMTKRATAKIGRIEKRKESPKTREKLEEKARTKPARAAPTGPAALLAV